MDQKRFLDNLKAYLALDSGQQFHRSALSWHAELARILADAQKLSAAEIAALEIVPLQDGHWIATRDHTVTYEPSETIIMDRVPPGLDNAQMAHQSASFDTYLVRLLQKLGVKQFDSKKICNLIIAQHQQPVNTTSNSKMLASHAVYLFQAQHDLRSTSSTPAPPLWVCKIEGTVKRSSALYLDLPNSNDPVSRHLADGPFKDLMLHGDIAQAIGGCEGDKWRKWLMDALGLSQILRVSSASQTGITTEFEYFLNHLSPSVSLRHLTKHWDNHFPNEKVPEGVRRAIASTRVYCDGKNWQRLDKLSLGCQKLKELAPKGLPFLDLQAIENEVWRNPKHFGVRVPDDYYFGLHCIRKRGPSKQKSEISLPFTKYCKVVSRVMNRI
jgi:hypothetical protein